MTIKPAGNNGLVKVAVQSLNEALCPLAYNS